VAKEWGLDPEVLWDRPAEDVLEMYELLLMDAERESEALKKAKSSTRGAAIPSTRQRRR
jgi:hypothetical protein